MTYLITQTFFLLLAAALLGLLLGWYLTGLSAASARSSLQARLRAAEARNAEIQGELDAAIVARDSAEMQRRLGSDEIQSLRAQMEGAGAADDALAAELSTCREALAAAQARSADYEQLQADLDACRATLDDAAAAAAPAAPVEQEADSAAIASAAAAALSGAKGLLSSTAPPATEEDAPADDLQKIKGIGPKIAGILRDLGIRRFEQIAQWTPENIEWVNGHLKFKGRIEREEWIPQAKALLEARD